MNIMQAVLGPAIAAGLIWFFAFRLWKRKAIHAKGHWGGALALSAALIVVYYALLGMPPLAPPKALDWLPYAGLIAGVLAAGQSVWGRKWYTYFPLVLILSGVVLTLQVKNKLSYSWDGVEGAMWIGGLSLAVAASSFNLEKLAEKRSGASMPMAMWAWCATGSVLLVLSGSALLGQLMGGLAGAFGAAVVLAWWNKHFTLTLGAMTVLAVLYGSIILQGYFYADMPVASALLAATAPLALWLGERRKRIFSAPWKAVLWRVLYLTAPMIIALVIAGYYYTRTNSGGGDYYSY